MYTLYLQYSIQYKLSRITVCVSNEVIIAVIYCYVVDYLSLE